MIEFENLRDINESFFNDFTHNFNNVLNTGVFVNGSYVRRFEEAFADTLEKEYCISCRSGADALLLSLKSLGLEKNSEIIVPSNSQLFILLAVLYSGCIPVPVEPDIKTFNINPGRIEEKLTSKTKAVLAVHSFGKVCNIDHISEISRKHGLILIEECSQSHGAKYKNKTAGQFGELAVFGLDQNKIIGALGDAGAIITGNGELAGKLKDLRSSGSDQGTFFNLQSFNSLPNELQNGFLLSKLKKLKEIIDHKRKLADLYTMFLKDDFIKPESDPDYFDVYYAYNIRHTKRDKLKEYLFKNEIQTRVYDIFGYKNELFREIGKPDDFVVSEEIRKTMLSLPVSFAHSEMDIFKVIEVINKF